ncbi:Hint domain-containing protein [Tropicimonas sp. TH_r6]|uniref:Hint domain-containing protein n=1 Tax=Tropicimonas sp. TH_r6 TaxID=3082085 RepID=UPI002954997C|nr:Hint domain-containing protein [Tropicimonas sp. TH_r6]MDV7141802.1 Hint domain-containing protein [Tropicimonas sp. TH_r6]
MTTTFTPLDNEFAAASGDNVNWDPDWSYFDHPPNSTSDLTITANSEDTDPGTFTVGETYDITWSGHGGGIMENAMVIRSDYLGVDQGAVVFEGINSNTGEPYQVIYTPGFDVEAWYWDNGGSPSSPNAFWTSDQDDEEFRFACYAEGTLIGTPGGAMPVERLRIGDLVMTLDHGPQPIRWVRQDVQALSASETTEKPVLIQADVFGKGCPEKDLIVSPQHRLLVGGHGQLQDAFKTEVLAPAKSLTKVRGIRHMNGKHRILWCHFACVRHEIVTANGCLSESLLLGSVVVDGMRSAERKAVTDIFGSADLPGKALNGPVARECIKVGAAQRQVAKS